MSTPDTLARELAALDDALAGLPVDPDLTDLAELAVALRDERPAPDPAFARDLDARAERGFPRAPRRGIKWPRFTLPALGVAASALLVVGIVVSLPNGGDNGASPGAEGGAASSISSSESKASDSQRTLPREAAAPPGSAPGAGSAASSPALAGPVPSHRRSVERSAQLVLVTTPGNLDRAAAQILRIADDVGGYVLSSTISSGSSGEFELRVPERRLGRALSRLSAVAKVRERTQSAQDITGAVVSVRGRLKDALTERGSLLRQLARATTPNQTASIRARLRIVASQIAAARRDLRQVKRRASYSSVSVTLGADRRAGATAPAKDSGWTPRDALDDAVRILEVSASVLLIGGALLIPFGLVGGALWLALRQASQRRRERALDAV